MGLKFTIGFILWEMTQWYSMYMRLFWTPKSCFFLSSVPWGVNTVPASISVMYLKTSWVLCKTREYNVKDCLDQVFTVFLRIGEEKLCLFWVQNKLNIFIVSYYARIHSSDHVWTLLVKASPLFTVKKVQD